MSLNEIEVKCRIPKSWVISQLIWTIRFIQLEEGVQLKESAVVIIVHFLVHTTNEQNLTVMNNKAPGSVECPTRQQTHE